MRTILQFVKRQNDKFWIDEKLVVTSLKKNEWSTHNNNGGFYKEKNEI